ncbi:hypothetical protein FBUS_04898 [Fasciolopsis buskii]|uniref:Uncharacterized protein n=1 Tax=Fasciolopsis buskii TaxID=27845 RepID=A0A8E0S0H2_9TREM|nr:hypothetical protein FBUS_04898 [Fasciolopsis buski]
MSDVFQGTLSPAEHRVELPSSPLHQQHQSPLHVRENLAGGTGVFANFFEEMADPSDPCLLRDSDHGEELEASLLDNSHDGLFYDASYQLQCSGVDPMHAYYDHCGQYKDDEDLNIIGQYKMFINRSRNGNSFDPYQSCRVR